MIVKSDGHIIQEEQGLNEKTRQYLARFWKLPNEKEIEKEREQLCRADREWALAGRPWHSEAAFPNNPELG